jgi:hypothetical protein
VQGYNGSQLWDTSFAAQALCDTGLGGDQVVDRVLRKAHSYVEQSQVSGMVVTRCACLGVGGCQKAVSWIQHQGRFIIARRNCCG